MTQAQREALETLRVAVDILWRSFPEGEVPEWLIDIDGYLPDEEDL